MANILDIIQALGGAPNLTDKRLMNTPGINPNAPDPRLQMPSLQAPQQGGSLLSPLLSKLGPIGRGADSVLGGLGGAARNAASNGALAAFAPRTTAGLMQGREQSRADSMADLQKRLIEARIGALSAPQGPEFVPLSAEEKQSMGIPSGSFAQKNVRTGQIKIDDPPGSLVSVNNEASVPQGFRARRDENGRIIELEPIKGGPADTSEQDENRRGQKVRQADIVTQEIDRALDVMGAGGDKGVLPDTGFGAVLANVPGTDAQRIANNLKTIKANIGFNQLNQMREASPTGGALGQVSERELAFLQAVAGSLDQSQSSEDLQFNLNRLWNAYQDVIHGPGKGPERRELTLGSEQDLSKLTDEELRKIANGG